MNHDAPPPSPRKLPTPPVAALTVAGSDSGGGAGIQADSRTFAAHGVLGCTAITALTAQNTLGVRAVAAVAPDMVVAQMEAVFADLPVRAVKTGMLADAAVSAAVAEALARWRQVPLVVDPVMFATSGDALLTSDGLAIMRDRLLPLATVLTPNLPEAAMLLGLPAITDVPEAARRLAALAGGRAAIVIKGGHSDASDRSADYALLPDGSTLWLDTARVPTTSTHGTGCTFSAAIAANLALGLGLGDALTEAKRYVTGALWAARPIGAGHGPVEHLWELLKA